MYYPAHTQATPRATIRRERLLPVPGRVLVSAGEHVDPQQTVAEASVPSEFRIVPVARMLGTTSRQVGRLLRVKVGDVVKAGQVIAARRGLNALSVRSPIAGRVTAIGGGRALIEAEPVPVQLAANLYGEVRSVIEPFGAVIEASGAVVQGLWGNGRESFGVLRCLVKGPDQPLLNKAVDPSCHGAVLVGGAGLEDGFLELATEMYVSGVVLGGLPADLLGRVRELPFPVVVTEGIGTRPMAPPLFDILASNDGREAAIHGIVRTRGGVVRPEVVIPLLTVAAKAAAVEVGSALKPGTRVRVIRAPYVGASGVILSLPAHAQAIATGARVRGAVVDVGQVAPVFVPLENLEILY